MSERPYLSIGEVLGLLLEEFPDVSISKIRFLEAQGLIDPERTSSGYRKFYDNDVERLRFILREQKDNYLPLKVIKDRLDTIDHTLPNPPRPIPTGASWLTAPGDEESVTVGSVSSFDPSGEFARGRDHGIAALYGGRQLPVEAPDLHVDPTGSWERDASAQIARDPSAVIERDPTVELQRDPTAPIEREPTTQLPRDPSAQIERDPTVQVPRDPSAPLHRSVAGDATDQRPAPGTARPLAAVESVSPRQSVSSPIEAGEVQVELSSEELCQRAGITSTLLKDLESFGLISSRLVSGMSVYGLDALKIASAAGRLSEHGLEPRHLRAWKTSADREVTLIEQLVQPLLRQRNPQARSQASTRATDLAQIGGELRNALVRMGIHALIES